MAYAKTDKFAFKVSFTGIELPLEALEAAIEKENPKVYFNDLSCHYWIFDFSFDWNGDKYWVEMASKNDPWVNGAILNVYQ